MTPIDYSIVALFLLFTFGIGIFGGRFVKNSDDYFVANRALPPFILAAAITATNVNLYSFIGQAGTASQNGISIIWQTWTGNMALVFSGLFILPIFRRLKIRSVPELLERRYSGGVRGLVGLLWVLRLSFWVGVVLYASALAASTITGFDSILAWVLIFGVITVIYTMIGGMWSVALNDILQFVLMLAGALIVFPLAMKAVGWMPGLVEALAESDKLNFIPQEGEFNWKFILAIFFLGIEWASVDQGLLQRAFGAKSTKSLAKGMVLAAIATTPFALLYILPGLASSVLHPEVTVVDDAIPTLYRSILPPVVIGIVFCGLLSSQISTISGNLNATATILTNDLYRRFLNKDAPSDVILKSARIFTLCTGVFMIGFSLIVEKLGGIVDAYLTVISIMDMPLFVVAVIYGLGKRATTKGALTSIVLGVAAGTLARFGLGYGFQGAVVFSGIAALVGMPIGTFIFKDKPDSEKVQEIFSARKGSKNFEADNEGFYSIIPISRPGRTILVLHFAALGLFFTGVISGGLGATWASETAIIGMIAYFLTGFVRLQFD